jgi:hypothetical protein
LTGFEYQDTALRRHVGVEIERFQVHTAAMAEHKFKLGESVYLSPSPYFRAAPSGLYEVVRHLPEEAGECWYRIKSASEGYERAVKESQLQKPA